MDGRIRFYETLFWLPYGLINVVYFLSRRTLGLAPFPTIPWYPRDHKNTHIEIRNWKRLKNEIDRPSRSNSHGLKKSSNIFLCARWKEGFNLITKGFSGLWGRIRKLEQFDSYNLLLRMLFLLSGNSDKKLDYTVRTFDNITEQSLLLVCR